MALNLQPKAQLMFFEKVFGPTNALTKVANSFLSKGVEFEVQHITVKATFPGGKIYQHSLLKPSAVLAASPNTFEGPVAVARKALANWLLGLQNMPLDPKPVTPLTSVVSNPLQVDPALLALKVAISGIPNSGDFIPVIKAIRDIDKDLSLIQCKSLAEKAKYGESVVIKVFTDNNEAVAAWLSLTKAGAKADIFNVFDTTVTPHIPHAPLVIEEPKSKVFHTPVAAVIQLRESKALGQKVRGSSKGSVYHTIAFNDRIKVAARINTLQNTVSIRAEWDNVLTPNEIQKFEKGGLSLKSDYASTHFNLNDVPFSRVIGAFLTGLGLHYDEVVTCGEDLVVSE